MGLSERDHENDFTAGVLASSSSYDEEEVGLSSRNKKKVKADTLLLRRGNRTPVKFLHCLLTTSFRDFITV